MIRPAKCPLLQMNIQSDFTTFYDKKHYILCSYCVDIVSMYNKERGGKVSKQAIKRTDIREKILFPDTGSYDDPYFIAGTLQLL